MKKLAPKYALERHWSAEEECPEGIAELLAGFVVRVFRAEGKGPRRTDVRALKLPRSKNMQ